MVFPLITTSSKLRGPFLPLRGEPHGFGFPAGRTPDNNQAPSLAGLQTMTEVALVPWHGSHQLLMTARDHAAGALVVWPLTMGGYVFAVVRGAVLPSRSSVSLREA